MSEIDQSNIDIVVAGFEADQSDNDILSTLFSNGVDFTDLRRLFNDIVKEKGLRLSVKDRKIKVNELLEGWEPEDASDVLGRVAHLQDELKISTGKAASSVRLWAKENDITLPKPEKKVREIKVGFGGVMEQLLDFALENRDADHADFKKFCRENEINENYAKNAVNVVDFAKKWES